MASPLSLKFRQSLTSAIGEQKHYIVQLMGKKSAFIGVYPRLMSKHFLCHVKSKKVSVLKRFLILYKLLHFAQESFSLLDHVTDHRKIKPGECLVIGPLAIFEQPVEEFSPGGVKSVLFTMSL